jgi:hypothetical protein
MPMRIIRAGCRRWMWVIYNPPASNCPPLNEEAPGKAVQGQIERGAEWSMKGDAKTSV